MLCLAALACVAARTESWSARRYCSVRQTCAWKPSTPASRPPTVGTTRRFAPRPVISWMTPHGAGLGSKDLT